MTDDFIVTGCGKILEEANDDREKVLDEISGMLHKARR